MKLAVLGSGSRGNAIVLSTAGVSLLVDAGFGPRTLAKRANQIGISLDPLVGVLLTHEHGDHARGAASLARRTGCPIFASPGTLTALADSMQSVKRVPVRPHRPVSAGPFRLEACRIVHDAAEPLAVGVTSPCGAKVGIAYDVGRVTRALRYLLQGVTGLVIEANHDDVLLRTGRYPAVVRSRIASSRGHLSNREAAELAGTLCHRRLQVVVLAHLSTECNRPDLAERTVRNRLEAERFRGRVVVAQQDTPLDPLPLGDEPRQLELGMAG